MKERPPAGLVVRCDGGKSREWGGTPERISAAGAKQAWNMPSDAPGRCHSKSQVFPAINPDYYGNKTE